MITPKAKFYNPYHSHEEEMAEVHRVLASVQTSRRSLSSPNRFWARVKNFFLRRIW